MNDTRKVDRYIERITKKYIVDYLNALLFENTVLWDGTDQFNELPIFHSSNEEGYRVEQRGALFVNKKTSKALRMSVMATESSSQRVCYRMMGLKNPLKIDEGKRLFYPFDVPFDMSIADLSLGFNDASSYSFSDNTHSAGQVSNNRLFTVLTHIIGSNFICLEDEDIFRDLANAPMSFPPIPSDPHYKPIFGVTHADDNGD